MSNAARKRLEDSSVRELHDRTKSAPNVAATRVSQFSTNHQRVELQRLTRPIDRKCPDKTRKNLERHALLSPAPEVPTDKMGLRRACFAAPRGCSNVVPAPGRMDRSAGRAPCRQLLRQTVEKQRVTTSRSRLICLTCPGGPFIIEIVGNNSQRAQFVRSASVALSTPPPALRFPSPLNR